MPDSRLTYEKSDPEFGVYGKTIHTFLYESDTRKRYIHMYYSAAGVCSYFSGFSAVFFFGAILWPE